MKFSKIYPSLFGLVLISWLFLAGCSLFSLGRATPAALRLGGDQEIPPPPPLDPAQVAQGERLYLQYCAACHKPQGEGDPDWKRPNEDGSFKPPPHTNEGHTWHHGDDLLLDLIANGSTFPQSRMPVN